MKEILINFTPKFHIYVPPPNLTWFLSLNNNPSHIYHLVSPFSPPTLFLDGFVLHISLVHEIIVTESTGSSGLWALETLHLRLQCILWLLEVLDLEGVLLLWLLCISYLRIWDILLNILVFNDHHPSPLLCFYKWGNFIPIHTSPLSALLLLWHGELLFLEAELQILLWGWM